MPRDVLVEIRHAALVILRQVLTQGWVPQIYSWPPLLIRDGGSLAWFGGSENAGLLSFLLYFLCST